MANLQENPSQIADDKATEEQTEQSRGEISKFRCTHQKAGCQWTGERGELDQHLNVNPEPEKQLEGCIFTQVECLHCHKSLQRHSVKEHQEEQCPKRHAKECPLQVVDCDFHYAGCEVKVLQKDMPQHLADNLHAHVLLLSKAIPQLGTKLSKQVEQSRNEMETLKRELNEKVEDKAEQSQNEVETLKRELNEKVEERQNEVEALKEKVENEVEELSRENQTLRRDVAELRSRIKFMKRKVAEQHSRWYWTTAILVALLVMPFVWQELGTIRYSNQELESMENQFTSEEGNMSHLYQELRKAMEISLKMASQNFTRIELELKNHSTSLVKVSQLHREMSNVSHSLLVLTTTEFLMTNFSQWKEQKEVWYSPPFTVYSNMNSRIMGGHLPYNVCIGVYANGKGKGYGTHISVFAYLLKSQYDDYVEWPFRGKFFVQLLNQLHNDEHHLLSFEFSVERVMEENAAEDQGWNFYFFTWKTAAAERVKEGFRAKEGWGYKHFIAHSELYRDIPKNRQYLKYDSLYFRVFTDFPLDNVPTSSSSSSSMGLVSGPSPFSFFAV